ncbi:MAG: peptide chain release factor N(5)-glutamine methyltransferase [Oscillospiraceae bacterium]|nr:peptide chain release factor N(5)-glutamine methyltransferase [Oscillospiraceae bacterium]
MLTSRFEIAQLFHHVTKVRVHELPLTGERHATEQEANRFIGLCEQRRAGVPLQYLLGEWEFYGLPFRVGRGVLIPRADTETLVDAALDLARMASGQNRPKILDLCSGAGCVAVAIAHVLGGARVTALENSTHALGYLRGNVRLNAVDVEIVEADLADYSHPEPLDLIVCNPPYIPSDVVRSLAMELRYEPRRALDGGADGLDFYRSITELYRPQLAPEGWLCFEIGEGQAPQVKKILEEHGYPAACTRSDTAGITRVVYARRD